MENEAGSSKIRQPAVAGQFYPGNPNELRREVERYINEAGEFPQYDPVALVAPHAAYIFSGWVAGYSYRQVRGRKFDAVVVISPCHVESFRFSAVMAEGAYQTPLGKIPIDPDLAREICSQSELVKKSDKGHQFGLYGRGEHSLEVQLPFLQVVLGDFKLVPIVMGDQSWETCQALGKALGTALKGKNALIVASTDLSHGYTYDEANRMDSNLIELCEFFNPREIWEKLWTREVEACGGGPVVASMIAGEKLGAVGFKALKHANSGDVAVGPKDSVVGYLSAVIYKKAGSTVKVEEEEKEEAPPLPSNGNGLTLEEKRQLMEIAIASVQSAVKGGKAPGFIPVSSTLKQNRGAFVTLKIDGRLRGCIGYIIPVMPLYMTVAEVAESAALKDPRFPPVSVDELPLLEYEISALSPIEVIEDPNEIVVGRDGIIIKMGRNQGLLLPQVATEYGWNREQFLQHTCRKAGLPPEAWKEPGVEISVFSAEVFGEEDLK